MWLEFCLNSSEAAEEVILKLGFVMVSLSGGCVLEDHLLNHIVARIFLLKKNWPWYWFSFGKWKGLQEEGTSVHKVSLFHYKQMSWNGRLCPVHPKSQASASGNPQLQLQGLQFLLG